MWRCRTHCTACPRFHTLPRTLEKLGKSAREQNQNRGSKWQMFIHNPNDIKVEVAFDQAAEPELPVPIEPERRYRASERFFNPEEYLALKAKVA
jgi:hypothetical protein